MKRTAAVVFVPVLAVIFSSTVFSQDRYVPFPVLFVHGVASDGDRWAKTRDALDEFFRGKYGYTAQEAVNPTKRDKEAAETEYFPLMDYRVRNNGSIPDIASVSISPATVDNRTIEQPSLKKKINDGLNSYALKRFGRPVFSDTEQGTLANQLDANELSQVKLNLVCHSMGGLVLRSLLKQDEQNLFGLGPNFYKNHINRVVFIGTPHEGSPLASALWLVNEQNKEIDKTLLKPSLRQIAHILRSRHKVGQIAAYGALKVRMAGRRAKNLLIVAFMRSTLPGIGPNIDAAKPAVEELRVPVDVSLSSVFVGKAPVPGVGILTSLPETVEVSYLGASTFLAQDPPGKPKNLGLPAEFRVVRSLFTKTILAPISSAKTTVLTALALIATFGSEFSGLPADQTIDDLTPNGDGVVTRFSQEAVFRHANKTIAGIVPIRVFHDEQPDARAAILEALEDKPEIERMYVTPLLPEDKDPSLQPWVLVAKIKDYLPADVEITSLKVGGAERLRRQQFSISGKTIDSVVGDLALFVPLFSVAPTQFTPGFASREGSPKPGFLFNEAFWRTHSSTEVLTDRNGLQTNYHEGVLLTTRTKTQALTNLWTTVPFLLSPGEFFVKLEDGDPIPKNPGDHALSLTIQNPAGSVAAQPANFQVEKSISGGLPPVLRRLTIEQPAGKKKYRTLWKSKDNWAMRILDPSDEEERNPFVLGIGTAPLTILLEFSEPVGEKVAANTLENLEVALGTHSATTGQRRILAGELFSKEGGRIWQASVRLKRPQSGTEDLRSGFQTLQVSGKDKSGNALDARPETVSSNWQGMLDRAEPVFLLWEDEHFTDGFGGVDKSSQTFKVDLSTPMVIKISTGTK